MSIEPLMKPPWAKCTKSGTFPFFFATNRQSDLLFSLVFKWIFILWFLSPPLLPSRCTQLSITGDVNHIIFFSSIFYLFFFCFYLVLPSTRLIATIKRHPISCTKNDGEKEDFSLCDHKFTSHTQQVATVIRETTRKDMNCLHQLRVTLEMRNGNSFAACCFGGAECKR